MYKRHNMLSLVIMCYKLLPHGNFLVAYHDAVHNMHAVAEDIFYILRHIGGSC